MLFKNKISSQIKRLPSDLSLISNLFCLSGIAALIYQVCWQRLLFTAFGVDMESITIIVSAFMLGLGMGALLGGVLADRYNEKILRFFAAFEMAIGTFGLCSPLFIERVADRFVLADPVVMAAAIYCLLLLPTVLMGATLPMLVVYANKKLHNVGVSVGGLYFVNTLGASFGSFLVGFVLFNFLSLNTTIYAAAMMNFIVALLVILKLEKRTPI